MEEFQVKADGLMAQRISKSLTLVTNETSSTTCCWGSGHDGREEGSGCGDTASLGSPDEGRMPSDEGETPCCDIPNTCEDWCLSFPSRAPASDICDPYAPLRTGTPG